MARRSFRRDLRPLAKRGRSQAIIGRAQCGHSPLFVLAAEGGSHYVRAAFTRFRRSLLGQPFYDWLPLAQRNSTVRRSAGLAGGSGVGVGPIGRTTADLSSSSTTLGGVSLALGRRYDMVLARKIGPRGRFSLPP